MRSYKNFTIHQYEELSSTNSHAFTLAENRKAFDREVIVADKQSSGRGRLDRKWESEAGNLFCSIIIKPKGLPMLANSAHKLSFFTSLALKNAISGLNQDQKNKIQLKWPNDLLINNKKVAGILLESARADTFLDFAIIGVGVNIKNYPQKVLFEATSLENEGITIEKDDFLKVLLDEFDKLYALIERFGIDETFKNIRTAWIKDSYKLNEQIEVNLGDEKILGVSEGIDEEGSLILLKNKEKIKINFGDVC